MWKLFEGKTVIAATHQLHLLPLFDTICFVERGEIIASGTLQQLLATRPQFEQLWLEGLQVQQVEAVAS